ncbi:hypothetical protein CERZMDRAFT_100268 [Cercospora zeae-maydis SCOH1-5]|uniref:Uncharacterized protein n=1 Tax=Cercospora zeae-maydis SCOH1-5 TaxID=717836 RepID=A0A6A6F7P8_9PEZI|nr:hypothetical protein CERZMDRAFT_100268 [Cercospora zeae-maydis SCOH1-5]
MHPRHTLAAALAALATTASPASAQTWESDMATDPMREPISASLMNITFSGAEAKNCGINETAPNTLSIAIRTIPQNRVCFDMGNTFSDPTSTYSMRGLDCKDNTICGVNYTITSSASDFSSSVQYTQIGYTQISNPFAGGDNSVQRTIGGRLELQVYNAANCKENDGVRSREWDCLDGDAQCSAMPFPVQSFSIAMTNPKDVGQSNCSVARVSGAERTLGRSGGGGEAVVLAGLLLVLGYLM